MVTWISLKAIAGSYLNIDRDKRILSSRTTQINTMADFWLRELYVKIHNGSPISTLILNALITKYEAIIKNYGYSNERTALLPESEILNNI